jgi:hypothetical protein
MSRGGAVHSDEDRYSVATGSKITSLSGTFLTVEPFESLESAACISDRHFAIWTTGGPTLHLCDLRPA